MLFFEQLNLFCSDTFIGIRNESMHHFMELCEMPYVIKTVVNSLDKKRIFPVIFRMCTNQKSILVSRSKAVCSGLTSGNGQFDSRGVSAKYCTYSIMNYA